MNVSQVAGIFLSLLGAVFLTSIEIAFAAANHLHIELKEEEGIYSGKVLSRFVKNPSGLIGTTLIGKIIALVCYSILFLHSVYPWLAAVLPAPYNVGWVVWMISLSILFSVYVLVVECGTKFVFLVNPARWLQFFVLPIRILYALLYPLVAGMAALSKWMIHLILRVPSLQLNSLFSLTDLNTYIEQINLPDRTFEEEVDTKILNNALSFRTIQVRDCMVPRTEISAVEISSSIDDAKKVFIKSGHSKILLYKESIDQVIGYCHILDLFRKPKNLQQILSPIAIVVETALITDLFIQFTTERKSLAMVVDEYGGTSGLVSLEDIVEHLFGEIQDEFDTSEDWVEEKIDSTTYLLSARHDIDYLNEKYKLNLPTGDYNTLNGLLVSILEDLPQVNQKIPFPGFLCTVLSIKPSHVDVVKLKVLD